MISRSSRFQNLGREKEYMDNQFQFSLKEEQLQSTLPTIENNSTMLSRQITNHGTNSNYFDNDGQSPSYSQWNSIYYWGNPIPRTTKVNYLKHRNSPEIGNPANNKSYCDIYEYDAGENSDRNTSVSPRTKNYRPDNETYPMLPPRNRGMGVSGQHFDRSYEYAKEANSQGRKTYSPKLNHADNFSNATNQHGFVHSSGLTYNESSSTSLTMNKEDDYSEPLDSIIPPPIRLNTPPSLQENKSTKALVEDVVPEAPSNHIYILPVDLSVKKYSKRNLHNVT